MTAEERQYLLAHLRRPDSAAEHDDSRALATAVAATWQPWDAAVPPEKQRKPKR